VPVHVSGMTTTFTFTSTPNGEGSNHGVVFLIQNDGNLVTGEYGPGLGYADATPGDYSGVSNSIAIEFDCVLDASMGDPSPTHVSVHTRNVTFNSAEETFSIGVNPSLPTSLCNGEVRPNLPFSQAPTGTMTIFCGKINNKNKNK